MYITYEYQNFAIAGEYRDLYPTSLPRVPMIGDHIMGRKNGTVLKVMAVIFLNDTDIRVTLGMDYIGVADPIFKDVVT